MTRKRNVLVCWICIKIRGCYIGSVIPFHALFNSQFFFFVWQIVAFQFLVWICMRARYNSDYGCPFADHVTCLLAGQLPRPMCSYHTSTAVPCFSCRIGEFIMLSVSSASVVTDFCVWCWAELDCRFIQSMKLMTNRVILLFVKSVAERLRWEEIKLSVLCVICTPSSSVYMTDTKNIEVRQRAAFTINFCQCYSHTVCVLITQ